MHKIFFAALVLISSIAAAAAENFQTFDAFDKYRQGCRAADQCEADCHKEFENVKLKDGEAILDCINKCLKTK